MNKKKILIVGVSGVAMLVMVLGGFKIAESKRKNNEVLQIEKKPATSITTTVITTDPDIATTTTRKTTETEATTTTTTETASEKNTTVTTTLPKEIIPEVTTTTSISNESTPTEAETTTTAINPENIEGVTSLSYEDVKAFVISNFDEYPERYTIYINNGVYYLNEYVIVFTDMENIGEHKETSLGMGIVVSSWAQPGYVIVMSDDVG